MTDLATADAATIQPWAQRHGLAVEERKGKYRLFDPVSRVHVCGYRFTASFEQIVLSLYAMDRATAWERSRKGGVRDGRTRPNE